MKVFEKGWLAAVAIASIAALPVYAGLVSGAARGFETEAFADTDPDSGASDDPCYLNDGSDSDVASLSGCNGSPPGPSSAGRIGGECAYDGDGAPTFGDCPSNAACYPLSHWNGEEASFGECGVCLKRCTVFVPGMCPSGETEMFEYDFCSSDCPDGMRCWVYESGGNMAGLCVVDCAADADCSSGKCDATWNVCIPKQGTCSKDDTDTGESPPTYEDAGEGGADAGEGNKGSGGCGCDAIGAASDARRSGRYVHTVPSIVLGMSLFLERLTLSAISTDLI